MPWDVKKTKACPANKPFGVIKKGGTKPSGCHATEASARKQQAALYASEGASHEAAVALDKAYKADERAAR